MSSFAELLAVARQQLAEARDGNVDRAIERLETRQQILAVASAPTPSDGPLIAEVLQLDKELAGLIRERMLVIREQLLATGRGQVALRGYGSVSVGTGAGVRINSAR